MYRARSARVEIGRCDCTPNTSGCLYRVEIPVIVAHGPHARPSLAHVYVIGYNEFLWNSPCVRIDQRNLETVAARIDARARARTVKRKLAYSRFIRILRRVSPRCVFISRGYAGALNKFSSSILADVADNWDSFDCRLARMRFPYRSNSGDTVGAKL